MLVKWFEANLTVVGGSMIYGANAKTPATSWLERVLTLLMWVERNRGTQTLFSNKGYTFPQLAEHMVVLAVLT